MEATQTAVMAFPCTMCGALFDLRYDLARYSSELSVEDVMSALKTKRFGKKPLCWKCRFSF